MMIEVSVTSVLKVGAFPSWGSGRKTDWGNIHLNSLQQFILLSADDAFLFILTGGKICSDALAEIIFQLRVQDGSVLGVWT